MQRPLGRWAATSAVCTGLCMMAFLFLWNWETLVATFALALLTYAIDLYDRGELNDFFK